MVSHSCSLWSGYTQWLTLGWSLLSIWLDSLKLIIELRTLPLRGFTRCWCFLIKVKLMHFLVGVNLIRFLSTVPLEAWSIQQAWFCGPGTGEREFFKSSVILNSYWNQCIMGSDENSCVLSCCNQLSRHFQSGGLHRLQTVGQWPAWDCKLPRGALSQIFPVNEDRCNL